MLATGAREKTRSARLLPGDRPVGIVTTGTLQSYVAFHGLMPFLRPLIIGSELVSYSALLTCLTHGARPAAMIEPETQPLTRAFFPLVSKIGRRAFSVQRTAYGYSWARAASRRPTSGCQMGVP